MKKLFLSLTSATLIALIIVVASCEKTSTSTKVDQTDISEPELAVRSGLNFSVNCEGRCPDGKCSYTIATNNTAQCTCPTTCSFVVRYYDDDGNEINPLPADKVWVDNFFADKSLFKTEFESYVTHLYGDGNFTQDNAEIIYNHEKGYYVLYSFSNNTTLETETVVFGYVYSEPGNGGRSVNESNVTITCKNNCSEDGTKTCKEQYNLKDFTINCTCGGCSMEVTQ